MVVVFDVFCVVFVGGSEGCVKIKYYRKLIDYGVMG